MMRMDALDEGRYETLIGERLAERLRAAPSDLVDESALRDSDAADRIAWFVTSEVERAIAALPERDRASTGIAVARSILERLGIELDASDPDQPATPGRVLTAIKRRAMDGTTRGPREPYTPLLDTTLLTNARGEPAIGHELRTEIDSADRIDVIMAFVRMTGIQPLLDELKQHRERGRELRILTTTYTGSTEKRALDALTDLGAEIKLSYDTSTTRLHAKAWLFYRKSGFSTAYIGSSNLTHSAQVSGLEWNVRVSGARNRPVIDKVAATFESYWNSRDFMPYDPDQFADHMTRDRSTTTAFTLSPTEVRLEPFQERLVELISVARERGRHRNLLAAATGTGKTVIAAVDYARLRRHLGRGRLLFVAHRAEILDQAQNTFRQVLRDPSFGEKWVGGAHPERFEHVFASVQSLNAGTIANIPPDHFDVVIIDEFHHAAAASYRSLLEHLDPTELLGLTATPERSDGLPILHWFDGRIAAELRLWDAIDQQHLVPFSYYGIHDGVDLQQVPWRRGRGYDTDALGKIYTGNDAWARFVMKELDDKAGGIASLRCLGFCVNVAHAEFMAQRFSNHGIAAVAVSGQSSTREREAALQGLRDGTITVVFSVDLFNEGVDVPEVDVLLMLRPTQSPTLFIQQLGRGLRRAPGKSMCAVLDFIGNHRREFQFDRKYRALLGGSRRDLETAVQEGFPFLPAGSHFELDQISERAVLASLKQAIPSQWPAKVSELRTAAHQQGDVTLASYLADTGLELPDIYSNNRCWSDLREAAGLATLPAGPLEKELRRSIGRRLHIDDDLRLSAFGEVLPSQDPPQVGSLSHMEQRLLRMLIVDLGQNNVPAGTSLQQGIDLLWQHPQVRAEMRELFSILTTQVDHIHRPAELNDVPLQIHARYTRGEILAAAGIGDAAIPPPWREGVYHATSIDADLLAFTLDKTSGRFSPTTRYRDYAISRELIHWESQSTTRASTPTGQRYQHHVAQGRTIQLFARERADERAFWYLGAAQYVSHEGEAPMAVTWRLDVPLPGDLYEAFAAAVA